MIMTHRAPAPPQPPPSFSHALLISFPLISLSLTSGAISSPPPSLTPPTPFHIPAQGEIQELRNMLHDLTQLQKDVDMRMRAMEGRAAAPAKPVPSSSATS